MQSPDDWLPPAPRGSRVAGGFDGSLSDDWTAIRLETDAGYLFTPRWGPDRVPTIWDPRQHGGFIPREQITQAWESVLDQYDLERAYCDPGFHDETSWETDIEVWATRWGAEKFVVWPTNQLGRMFPALRRFEADLGTTLWHDNCPTTRLHVNHARKIPKPGDRYVLGKPAQHSKIDLAVTSVLAHEAACDARAGSWAVDAGDEYVYV
jgi:hypothetical protein